MPVKKLLMCSASFAVFAFATSPALAQTPPPPPPPTEEGLPPSDETAEVATPPAEETAAEETIVVTGLRRSIQSSQNIKRNSDQIVDAIVAEDIGKLPDITASASLARITGVQVTRAAGEAADVSVRGLPDLSTTYNGREIFTAENRSVALQDFPAGGVAALEVYKSSTADLIEPGIAGQINVRSRRPFDFSGREIFGSVNAVHFEESSKTGINAHVLFSDRWDTGIGEIGVLLNGSYVETKFLDSTRENAFFIRDATVDGVQAFFPDTQAVFFGQGDRKRPSINGSVQWRPNSDVTVTFDGLWQAYRAKDYNRFLRFNLFGDPTFSNLELADDGVSAERITYANAPLPFNFTQMSKVRTDTYQFGANVTWKRDRLRVSADLAYTDSTFKDNQTNVDAVLFGVGPVDAVFGTDGDEGAPTFDIGSYDLLDPDNYNFEGLFERRRIAKGDDIQARLDTEYDLDLGFLSKMMVGGRFTDRDASRRDGGRFTFIGFRGIRFSDPDLPFDVDETDRGFTFDDVIDVRSTLAPTFGSVWGNIQDVRDFVEANADPNFPVDLSGPPAFEDQASFRAQEKTYTAYAQVKYAFDAGFPIDGLIGLRGVRTDGSLTGTSRVVGPPPGGGPDVVTFVPVTRDQEHTDWLPNASIRMEFMPGLQLRGAYTETRTKPRFDQLNPSANIDPPPPCQTNTDPSDDANCFRTGGGGNPNLRPLESKNYDLTLEYYFARAGSATLALFRRDVNGFIADATVDFDDPEFGRLRLTAPDNGGDGRLQGVELAVTAFADFNWVPTWARAFGLQANYTYIDNEAELAPSLVNFDPDGGGPLAIVNLLPGKQPIPNVSKHAFNLVGLYETEMFSARLAYNYRGKYVETYLRQDDPLVDVPGRFPRVAPVVQRPRGILDFSANVTPVENVTIFFDATNLLANPIRTYRDYAEGLRFERARKYVERTFSLGIRARM